MLELRRELMVARRLSKLRNLVIFPRFCTFFEILKNS